MTPQVLRIGPEGRRGALLSGLTAGGGGVCFRSLLVVGFLSLAALRRSPSDPARLKSKHVRSALSPRNLAICGFERNFFPQGLKENKVSNYSSNTFIEVASPVVIDVCLSR